MVNTKLEMDSSNILIKSKKQIICTLGSAVVDELHFEKIKENNC